MPEGPSIVILKSLCKPFKGKKITSVSGNTKIGKERLAGKKIIEFKSWGKHFLICFDGFTVRIHFLMFGSYRINEERELIPRLALKFKNDQLNFYSCSVKFIEEDLDDVYDWKADVMSRRWDPAAALKKIRKSDRPVCDILLDQNIFAGVGNIIKNEVLYRIKVHPLSIPSKLPPKKLKELIAEARIYSFDFLKWKKKYVLRKHWLAHTKKTCLRCNLPIKKEYLGQTQRRTFFCTNCQKLYR
jgi:endonuclease-8